MLNSFTTWKKILPGGNIKTNEGFEMASNCAKNKTLNIRFDIIITSVINEAETSLNLDPSPAVNGLAVCGVPAYFYGETNIVFDKIIMGNQYQNMRCFHRRCVTGLRPCAPHYTQCGGIGYSGATQCCSGSTCTYGSNYYAWCTPGVSSSNSGSCNVVYGQCGGIGWKGPTNCCDGKCTYTNEYYSWCATPSLTLAMTVSSPSSGCVSAYGRCGGIGYSGSTKCCSGSTCTYGNNYYAWCTPTLSSLSNSG
ncbi:unnamed protein product [Rotaria sp. Silwood2]|nr:unnamed protein product [Rotaria sp. Silwood2]CAF3963895.1 unnamed protein product [Rotaria sp. Silwood2]